MDVTYRVFPTSMAMRNFVENQTKHRGSLISIFTEWRLRAGRSRARAVAPTSRKARWDAVHEAEEAGNPITNARGFVFLGEPARHRR